MIILHGLFGALDNWLFLAKAFANNGKKVYLIDQRNHGKSPHSQQHTYTLMADDLNEFIEEHQIEKPIILGHSMGGKTAMKFAQQHPGMVDKLVIVDIAPKAYPVHHQNILNALSAVNLNQMGRRGDAEEVLARFGLELARGRQRNI